MITTETIKRCACGAEFSVQSKKRNRCGKCQYQHERYKETARDRHVTTRPQDVEWLAEVEPGIFLRDPGGKKPLVTTTDKQQAKVYAKAHIALSSMTKWAGGKMLPNCRPIQKGGDDE